MSNEQPSTGIAGRSALATLGAVLSAGVVAALVGFLLTNSLASSTEPATHDHPHPHEGGTDHDHFHGTADESGYALDPERPIEVPAVDVSTKRTAEILEDGEVSPAEYRSTIDLVIDCANERGAKIEPAALDETGVLLDYVIPDGSLSQFDSCYVEHGREIDIAYQTAPPTRAVVEEFYEGVAACLANNGVDYRALVDKADAESDVVGLMQIVRPLIASDLNDKCYR